MKASAEEILKNFVDYLMPELTPHEASMYIFLFRHSWLDGGKAEVRIGQRTIARKYGRGPKMATPSRAHVQRQLDSLEKKECIRIGDTDRCGTLYSVRLPEEIPLVMRKHAEQVTTEPQDYYTEPEKRKEIFEEDQWKCQYCGESVTADNVTLDHFVPKCNGGTNDRSNLRTTCLLCNSIKSGKSYEEAAIPLLKSIRTRRGKNGDK